MIRDSDPEPIEEEKPAVVERRWPLLGAVFGLCLGIALSVGAILTAASVSRGGGPGSVAFNVLVLGTDQRPDERALDPGRTDSMMLVSVSRASAGVSLVSIPRDLWVPIPGYGEARVNTAYRTGELDRPGSGAGLAKRTVGDALGIHVDRFVLVDMPGLRDFVNQLDGIDVDNPETLVDDSFPTDNYGTMSIMIPAGRQHLNGELALAYVRTRHQDSDFGRMGRQQQVISAILAKMSSPAVALRLLGIIGVLQKSTQTDLQAADSAFLGPAAFNLSANNVRRLVIGPDLVTPLGGTDGAALLTVGPSLRSAVASFLNVGS